jgi:hypothetical protein
MAERTRQLAQLFRYVRRGAVRIAASTTSTDRLPVAFVHPDGRCVVVVRARRGGGPLTLDGLPAGRYGVVFTGDGQARRQLPRVRIAAGQRLEIDLPGAGLLTLYRLRPRAGG